MLADAGSVAWVENPGYLGVRTSFGLADLIVHPIPVDADGMAPSEHDWQRHAPKLIHLTPSNQFPLGVMLSLSRRLDLIRRADACGAWIVEDDYDNEFHYEGRPLAAMQGLVEGAPVIYIGTFSRMLFPALRIGYLVVPPALVPVFESGLAELTWPGHAIEQVALAEFISQGKLVAHVRHMKQLYGERRTALKRLLEMHLGEMISVIGSSGGLHLTALLNPSLGITDLQVSEIAVTLGLSIRPLSISTLPDDRTKPIQGFLLGFSAIPTSSMDASVRVLRIAIEKACQKTSYRIQ
jgi:GntR family transcriptional regulator/MocR family aminotransferase